MTELRAGHAPRGLSHARLVASAFVRPTILDRYMIAELVGPFNFGLSAFTLIFAATNILAISRLVSEENAPLVAAVEYFLWQMPQIVVTVVPMAMLLGTLLALGRLSGESEITALKASGIGLVRAVAPLLVVGFGISVVAFVLQESIVPYANDQAVVLREQAIKHVGAFGGGAHTVISQLPGGGQQVTYFKGYQAATQELLFVTIVTYGTDNRPKGVLYSDRGRYAAQSWTFDNALVYQFAPDGSIEKISDVPHAVIDVGEKPSELQERAQDNDRESMSRRQIRQIIASGQLSPQELRAYQTTYEGKLARPFASFVFTLIAIPFALRNPRGGGTGLGFGLAIPIAFAYFVIASIFAAASTAVSGTDAVSILGAWSPNLIFTAIGALLLRRAARY